MKVLVAMSGGVDSAVAAALLVERGHDVVGVTLKQWETEDGRMPTTGCCTVSDANDARRVAAQLDIPYYVLDYVAEFTAAVVDRFAAEYMAGRTPNPCIECNRRVRFRALLQRATQLGCDHLATGHHARVERRNGRYRLLRGADRRKDQSYVLHMLTQPDLARVVLPIGHLTKARVREEATRLGLNVAGKPDSQDICFVEGDYRDFIRTHEPAASRPGRIVDLAGVEVGRHGGTVDYTIGQRKGLGLAAGEPRYVVDIQPATSTVVIGRRDDTLVEGCVVEQLSWTGRPHHGQVDVQVRYRSPPVTGRIDGTTVRFADPVSGVAPGQSAVFYSGDEVLGGGVIAGVLR